MYFIHLINNEIGIKIIKEKASVLESESTAHCSHDVKYFSATFI